MMVLQGIGTIVGFLQGIGIILAFLLAAFVSCNMLFQPIFLIGWVLRRQYSPKVHIDALCPLFIISLFVAPLLFLILVLFAVGGY